MHQTLWIYYPTDEMNVKYFLIRDILIWNEILDKEDCWFWAWVRSIVNADLEGCLPLISYLWWGSLYEEGLACTRDSAVQRVIRWCQLNCFCLHPPAQQLVYVAELDFHSINTSFWVWKCSLPWWHFCFSCCRFGGQSLNFLFCNFEVWTTFISL